MVEKYKLNLTLLYTYLTLSNYFAQSKTVS